MSCLLYCLHFTPPRSIFCFSYNFICHYTSHEPSGSLLSQFASSNVHLPPPLFWRPEPFNLTVLLLNTSMVPFPAKACDTIVKSIDDLGQFQPFACATLVPAYYIFSIYGTFFFLWTSTFKNHQWSPSRPNISTPPPTGCILKQDMVPNDNTPPTLDSQFFN